MDHEPPDHVCRILPPGGRERYEERRAMIVAFYNTIHPPPSLNHLVTLVTQEFGEIIPRRTLCRWLGSEGRLVLPRRNVPRIQRSSFGHREQWARYVTTTPGLWQKIVFSDEKYFIIETTNRGSPVVYTLNRDDPRRLRITDGRRAVQFMVFGVLTPDYHGDLCIVPSGAAGNTTAVVYGHVLREFVAKFMRQIGPDGRILLEDNATPHRVCKRYDVDFARFKDGAYPAHSPDFNAIERMWAFCAAKVRSEQNLSPRHEPDYLQRLVYTVFLELCHSASTCDAAMDVTWANLLWAASHEGQQRPNPTARPRLAPSPAFGPVPPPASASSAPVL